MPSDLTITLADVQEARARTAGIALRTPLVPLYAECGGNQVYLKLENLQPVGSFKIRGAANKMLSVPSAQLQNGVWTASAGNMAQAVAWMARRLGVRCSVLAPHTAAQTKIDRVAGLGAEVRRISMDEWMQVFKTGEYPGMQGLHIHAFMNSLVMAGSGVIALEILEELPDVEAIVAPYGGGGLSCGIASVVKLINPDVQVFAAEVATAAPLAASLQHGAPKRVEYVPSFVDGIGAPIVFPEMFEMARRMLSGSVVSSAEQIAEAVRLLASRNHVVAEGAGAAPVAAVLGGGIRQGKIACVVSGGCIDAEVLGALLANT